MSKIVKNAHHKFPELKVKSSIQNLTLHLLSAANSYI